MEGVTEGPCTHKKEELSPLSVLCRGKLWEQLQIHPVVAKRKRHTKISGLNKPHKKICLDSTLLVKC